MALTCPLAGHPGRVRRTGPAIPGRPARHPPGPAAAGHPLL